MSEAQATTFSAKASLTNHIVSIALAVITAAGVGFGFYYETKSSISKHSTDIETIQKDITDITTILNDAHTIQVINTTKIENLKESIDRIEINQREIIRLLKQ